MNIISKSVAMILRASMLGMKKEWHITRYSMYQALARVSAQLRIHRGDVLSISHSKVLCDIIKFQPNNFVELNYPEGNILSLPYPDDSFDFLCSDQVLEHISGDPQHAIDECLRVLRPVGIAVHTTCLINPIHKEPGDYWRFTPDGLRFLSRNYKEIIACDGWGNFEALTLIYCGLRFEKVPYAQWHPFHKIAIKNDPDWPIVTWVVAEK